MIEIDNISFRFTAPDESFAYRLYAGWDEFCRVCFEHVVDEYLSTYDKENVLTEIDCLDLDVGSIPEEDFYRLFPVRLREALERGFSGAFTTNTTAAGWKESFPEDDFSYEHASSHEHVSSQEYTSSHELQLLSALYHYLEHGFCKTALENAEFRPEEVLKSMIATDKEVVKSMIGTDKEVVKPMIGTDKEVATNLCDYPNASPLDPEGQRVRSRGCKPTDSNVHTQAPRSGAVAQKLHFHETYSTTPWRVNRDVPIPGAYTPGYGHVDPPGQEEKHTDNHLNLLQKAFGKRTILERLLLQFDKEIFSALILIWLNDDSLSVGNKEKQLSLLMIKHPALLWQMIEKLWEDDPALSGILNLLDTDLLFSSTITLPSSLSGLPKQLTDRYPHLLPPDSVKAIPTSHSFRLTYSSMTLFEKRRYWAALIEREPNSLSPFISDTEDNRMWISESLAEVMDSLIATKIITEVCRLQNLSVDISLYVSWMYSWLVEHYSLIGFSSFSDERQFQRKLNQILLHVLWANNPSILSSKQNLTLHLLKELSGGELENVWQILYEYIREREAEEKTEDSFENELYHIISTTAIDDHTTIIDDHRTSFDGHTQSENTHSTIKSEYSSSPSRIPPTSVDQDLQTWIEDRHIPVEIKIQQLNELAFTNPDLFLHLIGNIEPHSTVFSQLTDIVPEKMWIQWFSLLSLSKAELLQQASEVLTSKCQPEDECAFAPKANIPLILRKSLLFLLIEKSKNQRAFHHEDNAKTTKLFIETIYQTKEKREDNTLSNEIIAVERPEAQILKAVLQELSIEHTEQEDKEIDIEYLFVPNAGLALLTPWVPRLLGMLGLLNEEKTDLKDTESRIRAIFILQYLVSFENKEYSEHELAFNRILTGCPFSVPLPKKLALTEKETDTVQSMLEGVKANWQKMQNTSLESFQSAFINRAGKLESQDNKWILTVESRSFDMLLDSLPWSYKLIRFPWLKKHIHVSWRDDTSI